MSWLCRLSDALPTTARWRLMVQPIGASRTLADLGGKFWLGARCEHCFRWKDLDRQALMARLGANTSLEGITRRLQCSGCGSRNTLLFHGYDAGAATAAWGTVPQV